MAVGAYLLIFPPGPNPWGGLRLPWTYADREIWDNGTRLTAWLLLAAGAAFAVWWPAGMVGIFALVVVAIPYARALYVRKYGTSKTWHGGHSWIDYRPVAKCPNCGHLNRLNSADDLPLARCDQCGYSLDRRDEYD